MRLTSGPRAVSQHTWDGNRTDEDFFFPSSSLKIQLGVQSHTQSYISESRCSTGSMFPTYHISIPTIRLHLYELEEDEEEEEEIVLVRHLLPSERLLFPSCFLLMLLTRHLDRGDWSRYSEPKHHLWLNRTWVFSCLLIRPSTQEVKKCKADTDSVCCVFYPSKLFCCELPSLGDTESREVCSSSSYLQTITGRWIHFRIC